MRRGVWHWFVFLLLVSIPSSQLLFAQTSCGTITDQSGITAIITDCTNPFYTTAVAPSIGSFTIDTQIVFDNGRIAVPLHQPLTTTIQFYGTPFLYMLDVYKKSGADFIYTDGFNMFENKTLTFTEPGLYTVVIKVETGTPILLQQTLFQKILAFFIPRTIAFGGAEVKAVTFEVVDADPTLHTPSVLFIPGMQASRLYTDGVLGTENQLWEPNGNIDVQKLAMSATGVSLRNIYTRDVIDTINAVTHPIFIYDAFLRYLQAQKVAGYISEWKAFPYDWRYDVFDIVKSGTKYGTGTGTPYTSNPVRMVEDLASANNSRVTIIAHSNGGLLAKALMMELEKQGKADLVDKIIFLATPQLGTPKAIGAILHGYDQKKGGGWVIDDVVARSVIQNMPGVYGLLPSAQYFSHATSMVVTFDNVKGTKVWRDQYGTTITSVSELTAFMGGTENGRSTTTDSNQPIAANTAMMLQATKEHATALDGWIAPSSTSVFEIIGVGIDTVDAFTYQEFTYKSCTIGFIQCQKVSSIEPVPHITNRGDQTVVVPSAEGYPGKKKTYYVDLAKIKNDVNFKRKISHFNLTESTLVQSLIHTVIAGATTSVQYVSTTEPTYTAQRDIISVHSPVDIALTDIYGQNIAKTGAGSTTVIIEDIPGGSYMEFAGGKYIVVPSDLNYTVTLSGYATGTYTLQIATQLNAANPTTLYMYALAPATPALRATFSKEVGLFSTLQSDLNGDGVIDVIRTLNGEEIEIDNNDEDKDGSEHKKMHGDDRHTQHTTKEKIHTKKKEKKPHKKERRKNQKTIKTY